MTVRFKVIVNGYNHAQWIDKCLNSLEKQTYPEFDACITDDASTQEGSRPIITDYCERNGWIPIFNQKRMRAMHNIVQAVNALTPNDEDVIAILDGDDWLYHEKSLERIAAVYEHDPVEPWVTYGQYIGSSRGHIGHCQPPKWWWRIRRSYRKRPWIFGHMLTYKYFLFRQIKNEDFRDESGDYLPVECDVATIFPMMEMAGNHFSFIQDILYCYNDCNPLHDHEATPHLPKKTNPLISSRPKYKHLKSRPLPCYSTASSPSS